MNQYERAASIAEFLKGKLKELPEIAVVLGSGLGKLAHEIEERTEISYEEIPDFPVSTVEGHAGKMIFGRLSGKNIVAMQGRFHLYEGYDVEDVVIHVRVFKLLGIETLIVTNAAGAVNKGFDVGDLMIITDHIGLWCQSPLFGANDNRFGSRFPSMTKPYCSEYVELAERVSSKLGITVRNGVYCYCKGPMYETPAEIKALRVLGADAVGMSTVPEVITAVHSDMKVLGISCMTNMAAGILDIPLTHAEVMETGKKVEKVFSQFIREIIAEF